MKIEINGEWTLAQIRQCLFEHLLKIEEQHGIESARSVSLYFTPTDARGRNTACLNAIGGKIDVISIRDPSKYPAEPKKR